MSDATLAGATPSELWLNPHFQLAAEHFGYVADAPTAVEDREVMALACFLQAKLGEWTTRAEDYDKLKEAALWLRRSCKDRLPPGHYDKVSEECRAIDELLSPKRQGQP